jgi:hypothetical protein
MKKFLPAFAISTICMLHLFTAMAQQLSLNENCYECPLPKAPGQKQNYADILMKNGAVLYNAISVKRIITEKFGLSVQGLSAHFLNNGICTDTVLILSDVRELRIGGLGPNGGTLATPVFPAREFYYLKPAIKAPNSFLEITPFLLYAGSDESARNIGFDMGYGAEAIVSPFGSLLGEQWNLALQGALLMENGRMRFPVGGQIRFTFLGAATEINAAEIIPGPCKFRLRDTTDKTVFRFEPAADVPFSPEYEELTTTEKRDSTVFFGRKKIMQRDKFRPFLFAEGGLILNGTFDGAGRNPSVNPDDYGQFYAGIGLGMPLPFAEFITVSLAYRYMRLNLRTPCPSCPPAQSGNPDNYFFQNTNISHGIMLKLGYRLEWTQ